MILSDKDILALMGTGELEIEPFNSYQVGPTSIDLHISPLIIKYTCENIHLGKSNPTYREILIDDNDGYELDPGEFILASTLERVLIPNGYQGFIETKGDIARAGLQVHNADGHIDPGSNHVITLEIKNNNNIPIVIYKNILICQIFIHTLTSPCNNPYSGKYYGQKKPTTYIN